jgi:hypothetical protein
MIHGDVPLPAYYTGPWEADTITQFIKMYLNVRIEQLDELVAEFMKVQFLNKVR